MRPSALPRNCSWARTRTSYWSSPALKVEAIWPATSVFSAMLDIEDGNAEIGGARAVDLQPDFRLAAAQRGVGVGERRDRLHLREQRVGVLAELLQVGALDEVLDVGVALVAADGG